MNNIIVYIESDGGKIADISLELLTKGRALANTLKCNVEALLIGGEEVSQLSGELFCYGADKVHIAQDRELKEYRTLPYSSIAIELFKKEEPQIALFGATTIGRDLAPRVSSALKSGLTADCTSLEIGDHTEPRSGKVFKNLLYQIRPAFGGNIIATIINPENRPQIATVREGVMKREVLQKSKEGEISYIDVNSIIKPEDLVVKILKREIQEQKIDIKSAQVIVSGGFGVGSKENFQLLHQLAELLGGEVGASRAAVDAGFAHHARQVGQTGVTVRPKLYIAAGISGQIQHAAGMSQSSIIISINSDPAAPIHQIADYAIVGEIEEVIPKIIKSYKQNSK